MSAVIDSPLSGEYQPPEEVTSQTGSWAEVDELALFEQVHRQMRSLCGPHEQLEDLVQTALEQIVKSTFEGRSSLSTFTFGVCYRTWLKHLRFTYRLRQRLILSPRGQLPEMTQNRTTLDELEVRERYARLYLALDRVPTKRRAVVAMHDLLGMTVETIAEIVDTKVNTVRSRLRDGRKQLARLLHDDPYFMPREANHGP